MLKFVVGVALFEHFGKEDLSPDFPLCTAPVRFPEEGPESAKAKLAQTSGIVFIGSRDVAM